MGCGHGRCGCGRDTCEEWEEDLPYEIVHYRRTEDGAVRGYGGEEGLAGAPAHLTAGVPGERGKLGDEHDPEVCGGDRVRGG